MICSLPSTQLREIPCEILGVSRQNFRINEIECITGLTDLGEMTEFMFNNSEVEALIILLDKKFDLSRIDIDIYDFLINVMGFSIRSLRVINANENNFYDHMTLKESCEVILTKLIEHSRIESTNGFPSAYDFIPGQQNAIRSVDGKKWFPYIPTRTLHNYNTLLCKVLEKLNVSDNNLLFHGTSWEGADSIMTQIEIRSRGRASDFGIENFYTTDSFTAACKWANHNTQRAVVVFIMPEGYIESLEKKIIFSTSDFDTWRDFIYAVRNPPSFNRAEKIAYKKYVDNLDSQDLIVGPICRNPRDSVENIRWIDYNGYVPLQYSFKRSTIDALNQFIAITIFFQENA